MGMVDGWGAFLFPWASSWNLNLAFELDGLAALYALLLLLGESAEQSTVQKFRKRAEQDHDVTAVKQPYTMYFGPDEILLNLSIHFTEWLKGREPAQAVNRLEKTIKAESPSVKHIFIEAESIVNVNPPQNGRSDERKGQ